jgi:hypothetical protein
MTEQPPAPAVPVAYLVANHARGLEQMLADVGSESAAGRMIQSELDAFRQVLRETCSGPRRAK